MERMFVTFEGLDGSGKSTQAELLRVRLQADGVDVVSTREPGGTELGEGVRNLVLHGGDVGPWAEALLYVAARAQLVDCGVDVVATREAADLDERPREDLVQACCRIVGAHQCRADQDRIGACELGRCRLRA